jgi:hypothetical protein
VSEELAVAIDRGVIFGHFLFSNVEKERHLWSLIQKRTSDSNVGPENPLEPKSKASMQVLLLIILGRGGQIKDNSRIFHSGSSDPSHSPRLPS